MINLSIDDLKNATKLGNCCVVYKEYIYNKETPFSLYSRLCKNKFSFLFESILVGFYKENARFTFFGMSPRLIFKFKDYMVDIDEEGKKRTESIKDHPLDFVKNEIEKYKCVNADTLEFPFIGGAVGYMGYDTVRYYEDIPIPEKNEIDIYEGILGLYDDFFVFDHYNYTLKIVGIVSLEGDIDKNYNAFLQKVQEYENKILDISIISELTLNSIDYNNLSLDTHDYRSNIEKEKFEKNVEKAREHIINGDSYQIVLSQRLSMKTTVSALDIYTNLRSLNPSPYMFYMDFLDYKILGTSPEVMVRVVNNKILVCPLAGTRPRGKTEEEDKRLAQELAASEKERAEHIMLVDLARNDVGKNSKISTVKVEELMHFLKFTYVQHLNTNVTAVLREDKLVYDVFKAILPRGTVSGAPKIKSMEIISKLENDRRNFYGGAATYFSYNGNMDSAILIRTLLYKDNEVFVQAGAGIVYDSIPEAEYYETINKAKALLLAVKYTENLD